MTPRRRIIRMRYLPHRGPAPSPAASRWHEQYAAALLNLTRQVGLSPSRRHHVSLKAQRMVKFERAGHWRTNWRGTRFWISPHSVDRDSFGWTGFPNAHLSTRLPVAQQSSFVSSNSLLNPNATCPVCGQKVYFYSNSAGSKVYFDEVGPPWPKHPCTDTGHLVNSSSEYREKFENGFWGEWYRKQTIGGTSEKVAIYRKVALKAFEQGELEEPGEKPEVHPSTSIEWLACSVLRFSYKDGTYRVTYRIEGSESQVSKRFVYVDNRGPHQFDYFYMLGDRISYLDLNSLEIFDQIRATAEKKPKINKKQNRRKKKREARRATRVRK
jgi:hypothetical protein